MGASLKSPSLPVWVVCSESHFTVLFAADKDSGARCMRDALPFDLCYYDELANMVRAGAAEAGAGGGRRGGGASSAGNRCGRQSQT
mgnify:CR=1 FL=1